MLDPKVIPLSLYIHTPWCVKKCPYCDFNSHPLRGEIPEGAFISRLLEDLDRQSPYFSDRELHTVFIGGGTPSLISERAYKALFEGIRQRISTSENIEITLEANPGTLEQTRFSGYREAGINRLSIGVQSFDDASLKALGRIHDAKTALKAISNAQAAGFSRINIDLMHGLPNQTLDLALNDLQTAIELNTSHVSWYQLTLEPNTYFYRYPPQLPQDDALWDIQSAGEILLRQAGFEHYEISAFTKPGDASQHNLNYWTYGDYIGIGPGAHGKVTLQNNTIIRHMNAKHPTVYLANPFPEANRIEVEPKTRALELLMNALRLNTPYSFEMAHKRTGIAVDELKKQLLLAETFLTMSPTHFQTNEMGKRYLNEVLEKFI